MSDPVHPSAFRPLSGPVRYLLLAFAWLCVVLAIIGAILPGMPTTVFVLMAAWAAARSSPAFLHRIEQHAVFGPALRDWREGGFVSRRAKWMASLSMLVSVLVLWLTAHAWWMLMPPALIMLAVAVWLWCRPERPIIPDAE